jgi:hypothetical protein
MFLLTFSNKLVKFYPCPLQKRPPIVCLIIQYSNMTSFFRFINKRAIYRLGIVSLAHAPVHVTDFPVFNMGWRILVFYPEPESRDNIY